jgi:hypothetical protein
LLEQPDDLHSAVPPYKNAIAPTLDACRADILGRMSRKPQVECLPLWMFGLAVLDVYMCIVGLSLARGPVSLGDRAAEPRDDQ